MQTNDPESISVHETRWPLYILIAALSAATIISAGYLYHETRQNQELATSNQTMSATLVELHNELQALKDQVNSPPPPPARATVVEEQQQKVVKAKPTKSVGGAAQHAGQHAAQHAGQRPSQPPKEDPRFKQLQGQLSEQQKQLASTRDDLDKTREDLGRTRDNLQGNLDSTRGELSGSIARTHDELVALEKRGERNYYEFKLSKSKQFQRVGPLQLSLRKADLKHKRFDMNMMVDDNELQKKGVNLYETVWLNLSDRPQPLELVINQISKDHIQGYLSEPKYKRSELSQAAEARP